MIFSNKMAVTGGRNVHVSDVDFEWLLQKMLDTKSGFLILGDCPTGVDREILDRVKAIKDRWFKYDRYIAQWDLLGKKAGPIRNGEMIRDADFLVVFPGNKGTKDCTRQAQQKKIPIFRREK